MSSPIVAERREIRCPACKGKKGFSRGSSWDACDACYESGKRTITVCVVRLPKTGQPCDLVLRRRPGAPGAACANDHVYELVEALAEWRLVEEVA